MRAQYLLKNGPHCSIDFTGPVKQLAPDNRKTKEENGAEKEWLPKAEQKKAGNQSVPHQKNTLTLAGC